MTTEIKYLHLTNHHLFANLQREQLTELSGQTRVRILHKGEEIHYAQGDSNRVYFLVKGTVKICTLDENGNELIREVQKADDVFGQILSGEQLSANEYAKVLSYDAIVCEFRYADFEEVLRKNPELSLGFTKKVWQKLKRVEQRYTRLASNDVRGRLNGFIRDMVELEGEDNGESLHVKNYLTHNDIASLINTSRQTVTTLLNEMKEAGVLQYSRSEFIINNLKAIN